MRTWVIAILSTACVVNVNAFWLPQPSHSDVRLPQTALQSAQNGWDVTKRNFKYLLVPNAKQTPVAPAATTPEPVVSVPTPEEVLPAVSKVLPKVSPVVSKVPKVVPEVVAPVVPEPPVAPVAVPEVPRMQLEKPSHSDFDVNSVVHSMQDNYKSALGAIHDAPRIPGHAPSLVEYIKQGKFAGGEAVGDRLKHLPTLNFEALKDMQPLYFDALKKSIGSGIFSTGSEGMAMAQILQLKFDKMMNSMSGATIPATVERFTTSFQNLGALLQKDGFASAQEAIDTLDLDELGAYYLGAIGLFVIISQTAGGDGVIVEPRQNFTETMETGVVVTQSDTMQGQILELTKAITAMSKEMKVLQGEKATRDYEIATMKSDARSLKNQLDASESVEGDLRVSLKRMETQKVRQDVDVNSDCMAG
jgi:hypothetical protein